MLSRLKDRTTLPDRRIAAGARRRHRPVRHGHRARRNTRRRRSSIPAIASSARPRAGWRRVVEKIFSSYGLPNGYVLGEEGSGALIGGLTYGEGTLYTKNAGDHKVFWQGPSLGWDFGGQGSRTMMLVYNLDDVSEPLRPLRRRRRARPMWSPGVGFNVLKNGDVLLVPVRTGVGARLGVNVGYLKLTEAPTWNPF